MGVMAGIGTGFGVLSQILGLSSASQANKDSGAALNTLAAQESALITKQQQELIQEQSQPALIAQRQVQEQAQQNLKTLNTPSMNPINISSLGGLRGKLG